MPLDFPSSPSVNNTYSFGGKTWKWNGAAWEVFFSISGDGSITGTSFEVEVTAGASANQYIIGLPNNVVVGSGISTNYLNFANGSTFSGNSFGVTLSNNMNISGDLNIAGRLLVDGVIVSKSGFSGFTGNGIVEPVTDVDLDGGEF
jgi:hypothetical protein